MNDDTVVRREHGREVVDALLQPPMKRAKKKRSKGFSLDRHLSDFFVDRAQTLPEKILSSDLVLSFWWSVGGHVQQEFLENAVLPHQRGKVVRCTVT